jgi:copper chaperone CopZ
MSEKDNTKNLRTEKLTLLGATCPSCAHAIRHAGRRLEGVRTIEIDPVSKELSLEYEGDDEPVKKIQEIIRRLGYDSVRRED